MSCEGMGVRRRVCWEMDGLVVGLLAWAGFNAYEL